MFSLSMAAALVCGVGSINCIVQFAERVRCTVHSCVATATSQFVYLMCTCAVNS